MKISSTYTKYPISLYENKNIDKDNKNSSNVSFNGKSSKARNILLTTLLALSVVGCVPKVQSYEAKTVETAAETETLSAVEPEEDNEYTYTVKEGDSLSSIVRKFVGEDATWDEVSYYIDKIAENNDIEDSSVLPSKDKDGNPVKLDISSLLLGGYGYDEEFDLETDNETDNEYTVKEGDTLASIVRQYIGDDASWDDISYYVEKIAEENGIEDISALNSKDKDGNPTIIDISCLYETNTVNFEMPSKEIPLTDSNGNIVASITKVNSTVEGELTGKTIMINAGHGGFNPTNNIFDVGASNGELEEYALTNRYTEMLAQKLVDNGANVVICQGSVNGGSKSPVGNAIQDFAQEMSDDIENTAFISIHFDSYENTDIKGGSVRYQEGSNSELAQILCNALSNNGIELFKETPVEDRLLVTNTATSNGINNAVLIECATLTNSEDYSKVQTDEFKENITDAILEGIIETFK